MEKKTVEITRSFERTVQVKQYEPVRAYCAAKMEVPFSEADKTSELLGEFVSREVEQTIRVKTWKPDLKSRDVGRDDAERNTEGLADFGDGAPAIPA